MENLPCLTRALPLWGMADFPYLTSLFLAVSTRPDQTRLTRLTRPTRLPRLINQPDWSFYNASLDIKLILQYSIWWTVFTDLWQTYLTSLFLAVSTRLTRWTRLARPTWDLTPNLMKHGIKPLILWNMGLNPSFYETWD